MTVDIDCVFLFTDIVASSRLWEQFPDAMAALMAAHDAATRSHVEAFDGRVVKFTGDGAHAVFHDVTTALDCAICLQGALNHLSGAQHVDGSRATLTPLSPQTPQTPQLSLRMGIHRGPSQARDGDFYGETVNRAARIAHAAHGGQILLSEAAEQQTAANDQDRSWSLRALGRVRLRDLSGEETLYQVEHPDLIADFPPLRSLATTPNNLPAQRTSFIGRYRDVRAVALLLQRHRLVTAIGAGGMGKTRLALQVAARVLDDFADGVWFVALADFDDSTRVADAILASFSLRTAPGSTATETLLAYLARRQCLIVLDNCEHLIDAAARLADQLLIAAPEARVLATSREALALDGEACFDVPGLPMPDPDALVPLNDLTAVDAVRLFIERAQLQDVSWHPLEADAPTLAKLCYQLDGIPLAIELAAARMRSDGLAGIVRGVEDRFGFLVTGSRAAPPRHKTLAGMIDWSVQRLTPNERALFDKLAVFVGGINAEVAAMAFSEARHERMAATAVAVDIAADLAELADKSLIRHVDHDDERANKNTRYVMLETIRQFAAARLDNSNVNTNINARREAQLQHAEAFHRWAAPQRHLPVAAFSAIIETIRADEQNLQTALDVAVAEGRVPQAMVLGALLGRYWMFVGRPSTTAGVLTRVLALPSSADAGLDAHADVTSADRAIIEYAEAVLAYLAADMARAILHGQRAVATATALGDANAAARAQTIIAYATYVRFGYAAAREHYHASLDTAIAAGATASALMVETNFAINALYHGDDALADALYASAVARHASAPDARAYASLMHYRGLKALTAGDGPAALAEFSDLLASTRVQGEAQREGVAHMLVGRAHAVCGNAPLALVHFRQSITLLESRQLSLELMNALEAFAGFLAAFGAPHAAIVICAATAAHRERIGLSPGDQAKQACEYALSVADAALEMSALANARAMAGDTGRRASLGDIVRWVARAEVLNTGEATLRPTVELPGQP